MIYHYWDIRAMSLLDWSFVRLIKDHRRAQGNPVGSLTAYDVNCLHSHCARMTQKDPHHDASRFCNYKCTLFV